MHNISVLFIKFLSLLFLLSPLNTLNAQSVIYVNTKASGKKDGTSWTDAFVKIEDAISNSQIGDTIFVAKGNYKPSGSGVNATFTLAAGRLFYGGFVGTESSLKDRKLGSNVTYLDGDIGTVGVASDNVRFVISLNNLNSALLLDGFSIVNGYAYNGSGGITYGGGGLRIINSKINLVNCRIHDNYTGMRGGGIYSENSTINITDCVFINNSTGSDINSLGGAIFMNSGLLTIKGTRFTQNKARRGGAISTYGPTLKIDRSVFSGNEATNSASTLDIGENTTTEIYNSLFVGSADCILMSPFLNAYSHKIINCTFADNSSSSSSSVLVYINKKTEVVNCIFWNRGKSELYYSPTVAATVKNCLIKGGYPAGANISRQDPKFVKPGKNLSIPFTADTLDYSLLSSSPAINSGNDSFLSSNYNIDLNGKTRTQNGVPDLGAIESPYNNYLVNVNLFNQGTANIFGAGSYPKDSMATIIARPSECFSFLYWKENDTIIGTDTILKINVTQNRNLIAYLKLKQIKLSLTANPISGGTVKSSGSYNCNRDTALAIIATADSCYTFVNWTRNGNEVAKNSHYYITPNEDMNLVANFKNKVVTVSINTNPSGVGNTTGAGNYLCNDSLTSFSATATDPCYTFLNWTIGTKVVSSQAVYIAKVKTNLALTANFQVKKFMLNLNSNPTNGGTVTGSGQYSCNATAFISAKPNTGFVFENWKQNGTVISTSLNSSISVKSNLTLEANFKISGGIERLSNPTDIVLFPNPGNGQFTVSLANSEKVLLSVFDVNGRLIFQQNEQVLKNSELYVDTSFMEKGVYFINIKSDNLIQSLRYIKI